MCTCQSKENTAHFLQPLPVTDLVIDKASLPIHPKACSIPNASFGHAIVPRALFLSIEMKLETCVEEIYDVRWHDSPVAKVRDLMHLRPCCAGTIKTNQLRAKMAVLEPLFSNAF